MKRIFTLLLILASSFTTKAQTFSWSGYETIFDMQTDTIPITVSGLPSVIDTNFGVVHICINVTHTYKADLLVKMRSPDGTLVTLIQNIGGSNNNFIGTCLGMDGTSFSNGAAPFSGIFIPIGDVNSFNNGQNPNGIWKLIVSDVANADTGSIHNVNIEFTNNPPQTNPSGGVVTPTGTYNCATCVCPGGAAGCDLLPDMTSSAKEILVNHNETPGFLYISNTTPNIGYGPIEIYGIDSCFCGTTYVPCGTTCPNGEVIKHIVKQRIYQKLPGVDSLGYYDRIAGAMSFHPTHGHLHVDNWASYTLRTPTADPDARNWPIIATGTKQSFCLVNLGTCAGNPGECLDNNGDTVLTVPNQGLGFHTGCGLTQGIYPGSYDVYSISLNDPIPLNNICNGTYYVVSITDPNNDFLESDENNNWVAVPITLTQQNVAPSITANGSTTFCQGGSVTLTSSIASNYLWSTGDTTRSIVVTSSGTYTVSSACGTSTATSTAVTVNVTQINVDATATPSSINCNGESVQLAATTSAGGTQNQAVTFTNNQPVFIPDNYSTGITSTIPVTGINPLTLTSNTIVSVRIYLTHTYDGDLAISLISPSGNSIFLSNRRGGGNDNFINTVFTMSATTLISSGAAPFTGNYKPDGDFNTLTGDVNGNWLLKVQDLAGVDTGRVHNWSITINNLVPEIPSYSWTSNPPGFTSTAQNPVVNPTESTTYFVVVSSSLGCYGSTSTLVDLPPFTISSFTPSSGSTGTVVNIYGEGFVNGMTVTIAGSNAVNIVYLSSTHLQAEVPAGASGSGPICVTKSGNCTACSIDLFSIGGGVSLQLKVLIEGFYQGGGIMTACVDAQAFPTLCDTITLGMHETIGSYPVAYVVKGPIDINGNGSFELPSNLSGGSYYISVQHRNAIETWSSNPVLINGSSQYDFTTAKNKAFGSNLSDLGDGKFGLFSGDISDSNLGVGHQDGVVESQDYGDIESAVIATLLGYTPQDLTGDGIVESSDYGLMENNVHYTMVSMRP